MTTRRDRVTGVELAVLRAQLAAVTVERDDARALLESLKANIRSATVESLAAAKREAMH